MQRDYHVFFIHQLQNKEKKEDIISKVYDLDTVLAFPEDFENYFDKSFNFEKKHGKKQIEVLIKDIFFRVIEANLFVENFASDRSHMVTGVKKEGKKFVKAYSAPPPDYPNIINSKKIISIFNTRK